MESNYSKEKNILIIKLSDDIDQYTVDKIRRKMDDEIERYIARKVIFDFSNISFMDSSGIGMVLGRYKLIKLLGGNLELINVSKQIKKIFDMCGVTRLISIMSITEQTKNTKEEDCNEGII